jgi:hypothetical protein
MTPGRYRMAVRWNGGTTMTEIVEFSFYPDSEAPEWGLLHILTDAFGGELGRRATMRGDPDLVRGIKLAYHDRGGVIDDGGPRGVGGTWQMAPGWPDDWDVNAFEDEEMWSQPFEIGPDGRVIPPT